MKKMQKGSTLVEVLVAMTVFLIICGAIFTSVHGIAKIISRQEEALRIDYLFSDIESFYNSDESTWVDDYLVYLGAQTGASSIYLDSNLTYDKDANDSDLTYDENANGGLYRLELSANSVTLYRGGEVIASRTLGGQK